MSSPTPPLDRQLNRARRRLFLQALCDTLTWCWTAALVLLALGLLLDRRFDFLPETPVRVLWYVLGGALAFATLLGILLAVWRTPRREAVALAVDDRFDLRERVTTLLLLGPDQRRTPAGEALRADVDQRLGKIDVRTGFPVRPRWTAALVPLGVALMVLASFVPRQAQGGDDKPNHKGTDVVAEKSTPRPKEVDRPKNADPGKKKADTKEARDKKPEIEPDVQTVLKKPRETPEEIRQGIKELGNLEKQRQDQLKERLSKDRNLSEQLRQMQQSAKNGSDEQKKPTDGPARDLQKALSQGKLDQAKQEAQKLSEKMQKGNLSPKEKQELQKQLEQTREKLERLARNQDKRDQLDKLHREGKLDDDKFKEAMDKLDRQAEQLKDVQELAKQLEECKQCMNQGDKEGAAKAMAKAAEQLRKMDGQDKAEQMSEEELARDLDQIRAERDRLRQCMTGNSGGPPGDRRPEKKDADAKPYDSRQRAALDKKGQFVLEGYTPGQNYTKKKPAEVEGQVKRARQEGPQALEHQPIPPPYRNTAKDYYDNLGDKK
jgi:hypothetical protein